MVGPSLEGMGRLKAVGVGIAAVAILIVIVALVGPVIPFPCLGDECEDGTTMETGSTEGGGAGSDFNDPERWEGNESEPGQAEVPIYELSPVAIGERLTQGNCEGTGAENLTHLPMRVSDIGEVVPYGKTTGAHVTPIDHQYFYPTDFELGVGSYPVYAMSDGHIYLIDYSEPSEVEDTGIDYGDYGVYITHSCTHFYYQTILKELSPRLQAAFEEHRDGRDQAPMFLPVKGGEQIGYVGGNSVDFAVFDTTQQLQNFISPQLYLAEPGKLFIADPFDYYTEDVRQAILPKYPRTAEPLGGRIDYDIEGKLRGNWFVAGMNGYRGAPDGEPPSPDYWRSHLAIYPDHFDPSATIVSIGDFDGGSEQLAIPRDSQDPALVGVGDGLITYRLYVFEHVAANETDSDDARTGKERTVKRYMERGCVLFEMPANQTLKAEFFPDRTCDEVSDFTDDVTYYER